MPSLSAASKVDVNPVKSSKIIMLSTVQCFRICERSCTGLRHQIDSRQRWSREGLYLPSPRRPPLSRDWWVSMSPCDLVWWPCTLTVPQSAHVYYMLTTASLPRTRYSLSFPFVVSLYHFLFLSYSHCLSCYLFLLSVYLALSPSKLSLLLSHSLSLSVYLNLPLYRALTLCQNATRATDCCLYRWRLSW